MPGFQSISAFPHSGKQGQVKKFCPIYRYISPGLKAGLLILAGLTFTTSYATGKIRYKPGYRFEADLGYGFPEAIGIKLKYGNQIQAGVVQPFDTRGPGPTGFELYYHFGEKPRLLDQSPWYASGGFSAYLFKVDYQKEYNLLIYPRIGRSFYFSGNSGINMDVGPGFAFGLNINNSNHVFPVLFTGSLTIFIRF